MFNINVICYIYIYITFSKEGLSPLNDNLVKFNSIY